MAGDAFIGYGGSRKALRGSKNSPRCVMIWLPSHAIPAVTQTKTRPKITLYKAGKRQQMCISMRAYKGRRFVALKTVPRCAMVQLASHAIPAVTQSEMRPEITPLSLGRTRHPITEPVP